MRPSASAPRQQPVDPPSDSAKYRQSAVQPSHWRRAPAGGNGALGHRSFLHGPVVPDGRREGSVGGATWHGCSWEA